MRVFLEEFFARFRGIELAGEVERLRSGELDSIMHMPMRLKGS